MVLCLVTLIDLKTHRAGLLVLHLLIIVFVNGFHWKNSLYAKIWLQCES